MDPLRPSPPCRHHCCCGSFSSPGPAAGASAGEAGRGSTAQVGARGGHRGTGVHPVCSHGRDAPHAARAEPRRRALFWGACPMWVSPAPVFQCSGSTRVDRGTAMSQAARTHGQQDVGSFLCLQPPQCQRGGAPSPLGLRVCPCCTSVVPGSAAGRGEGKDWKKGKRAMKSLWKVPPAPDSLCSDRHNLHPPGSKSSRPRPRSWQLRCHFLSQRVSPCLGSAIPSPCLCCVGSKA